MGRSAPGRDELLLIRVFFDGEGESDVFRDARMSRNSSLPALPGRQLNRHLVFRKNDLSLRQHCSRFGYYGIDLGQDLRRAVRQHQPAYPVFL